MKLFSLVLLFLEIIFASAWSGCRDEHPQLCKDYTKNHNGCLIETGGLKAWMEKNCMKTCNTCHLSTQAPTTTTTIPPPLPMDKCGRTQVQQARIINGKNAKDGAWPWQAALYYAGRFKCGATIVSHKYVVTAAHCVYRAARRHMEVIVGATNRQNLTTEHRYKIRTYYLHHQYHQPTWKTNDIAVIKILGLFRFTPYVERVCLPEQDQAPAAGTICYATGWGKTVHPGTSVYHLQQTTLPIADHEACRQWNGKMKVTVTKSMLCAGNLKDANDGCHGDSGGPLVCQNKTNGRWFLHGVFSWGSPICKAAHAYSVFSNVSHLRTWMDYYIWRLD